ncbi:MAG: hypothetical protein ACE5I7_18775 [Candidatus Binatia bacterium]
MGRGTEQWNRWWRRHRGFCAAELARVVRAGPLGLLFDTVRHGWGVARERRDGHRPVRRSDCISSADGHADGNTDGYGDSNADGNGDGNAAGYGDNNTDGCGAGTADGYPDTATSIAACHRRTPSRCLGHRVVGPRSLIGGLSGTSEDADIDDCGCIRGYSCRHHGCWHRQGGAGRCQDHGRRRHGLGGCPTECH